MKTELENELGIINRLLGDSEREMRDEVARLKKERVEPMRELIRLAEEQIMAEVLPKYDAVRRPLLVKRADISMKVDEERINAASLKWYAPGTIVCLWEKVGYTNRKYVKRDATGVVLVYDGTQTLASVSDYRHPEKGEILVIRHKKDGCVGLKFDVIKADGFPRGLSNNLWLAEGDTPENNPVTRKAQQDEQPL